MENGNMFEDQSACSRVGGPQATWQTQPSHDDILQIMNLGAYRAVI